MSEYKFSHQFSQHWLAAPQKVRQAIIQELEDIILLLDNDTTFESFEFRQPNLTAYIDQIYAEAEGKNKSVFTPFTQPSQAQSSNVTLPSSSAPKVITTEQVQPIDNINNSEVSDNVTPTKILTKTHITQSTIKAQPTTNSNDNSHTDSVDIDISPNINETDNTNNTADITETVDTQTVITTVIEKNTNNITANITDNTIDDTDPIEIKEPTSVFGFETEQRLDQSIFKTDINDDHPSSESQSVETLIHELENRIDDYLNEQMSQISKDLKAWLRDEIKRHLDKE